MKKILLYIAVISLLPFWAFAATQYYYIANDGTDSGDCTNINSPCKSLGYLTCDDLNGGQNGSARVDGGDGDDHVIYFRGGTHDVSSWGVSEHYREIRTNNSSGDGSITIRSYPGEWAVLDCDSTTECIEVTSATHNINIYDLEMDGNSSAGNYWCINARNDAGQDVVHAFNWHLKNIYCHDTGSHATVSLGTNAGGFLIAMQSSIVEYCTFEDNGRVGAGHNHSNFHIMHYYGGDSKDSESLARRNNIFRYNFIEGGEVGIKDKGAGVFTDQETYCNGTIVDKSPSWANEYHHNIIKGTNLHATYIIQDYIKFHHNLITDNYIGFYFDDLGNTCYSQYMADIYNNTFINNSGASYAVPKNTAQWAYGHDFYNNLIIDGLVSGYAYVRWSDSSFDWDMTVDYNGIDNDNPTTGTVARVYSTTNITFSAWQALDGDNYDANSLNETLSVQDKDNSQFWLPSGSNAIGAGRSGEDLGAFGSSAQDDWYSDAGYYGLGDEPGTTPRTIQGIKLKGIKMGGSVP